MNKPIWTDRTMWTGDNLPLLRGMNSESDDLIYLDPPFNSNRNYSAPIGSDGVIDAASQSHGPSMKSYLIMMAVRLIEMKRVLKDTGSIFLHCGPQPRTTSSY